MMKPECQMNQVGESGSDKSALEGQIIQLNQAVRRKSSAFFVVDRAVVRSLCRSICRPSIGCFWQYFDDKITFRIEIRCRRYLMSARQLDNNVEWNIAFNFDAKALDATHNANENRIAMKSNLISVDE